ncbi:MAG: M3 family oligoendopeptidase, partial [Firmicutes bacterium]|nr:M3 family oligoendopeptidase [Bacillota bacterium]
MNQNENWTFASLTYERPDFEAVKADLIAATKAVKEARSGQEVLALILAADEKGSELQSVTTLAHIRHTIDTRDAFYEAENAWLDEHFPLIMPYSVALSQAVAESPFRPYLEEKLGKQYFVQNELMRKSFCEANIPLMQQEAKLTDEYQKIMAGCEVEFRGETCNLYGLQKHFEDDDRDVRRAAFRAYSDFYHENEPRLEEIWDELIRIRNEMGRNLGFDNYIPLGYLQQGRTDYGQEEVAAFREQVRTELVPLCEKLYAAQARRLGIDRVYVFDEKR